MNDAWLRIAAQTVPLLRRAVLHHGLGAASAVGVDEVVAEGPAQRAGLRSVYLIVSVDAVPTPDVDTLHRVLGSERIGRRVRMDLLRGAHRLALDLVPDMLPDRHAGVGSLQRG